MLNKSSQSENGTEPCTFRHRNSTAADYIVVSQAILTGYPDLTDGAKLTYLAICSYDWYDPSKGGRKGYVFPTIGRLAQLRSTTARTIQRHLGELILARLLTRVARRGKASVIYIEEPIHEEPRPSQVELTNRGDISVGGGVTLVSPQQEEKEKQTKSINGLENTVMEEGRDRTSGWTPIRALLPSKPSVQRVLKRDQWLANEIVVLTGDSHSLGCYRAIASRCPQELVFEAMSLLKEARRDGSINRSRGALFVGIVRRLCRERGLPDPLGTQTDRPPNVEQLDGMRRGDVGEGGNEARVVQ